MAQSRSVELVGRVLDDRYRLTRPVGTGSSAHVYAAEDVRLRRMVAVKVLHPGLGDDPAFGRRFQAEARAAAGLRHPHILQVYDSGEDGGTQYLVMELLGGGSLRSLLDRGQLLTPSQAVAVGADVAQALSYAHRHGVAHRDIKPANLIFDDEGRITVADFGLARALAAATWTEPIGGILGTARYASPEQVKDQATDGRADVYALALVLVEAVTGAVPFASDSAVGALLARVERPIAPGPGLGSLAAVVEAAGTVDPEDRIDAAGMAAALDRAAAFLPAPGPLPLVGLAERQEIERDNAPTEIPGGRRVPFDIEVVESLTSPSRGGTGQPAAPPAVPAADPPSAAIGGVATAPVVEVEPRPAAVAGRPRAVAAGRRPHRRRWLLGILAVVVLGGGGAAVAVVAGRPPPTHPIPSLISDDQARAQASLAPLHLHLAVTGRVYDPTVAAGEILTQTPSGGRSREGATIGVTISLGPQPIPVPTGLAGAPQADAARVVTTLGLTIGHVTQAYSLTVPLGTVISSSPASGTLLPGRAVALVVSEGKPFVAVPPSTGTYAAVSAALQALGLPATETESFSDTVSRGQVIASTPPAGTSVRVGTSIAVEVSKGPDVVAVPNVAAESVTAATQALTDAGLVVTGVTGNPTATVTSTSPTANSVIRRGTDVTIITG